MQINRNIIINNPDKELIVEIINYNFKQNQLIDFWNSINKNIIIKENKKDRSDYIFFCKDKYITENNPDGFLMYYNEKTECLAIDYEKIWLIFESKFKLNRQSINNFIIDMMFKTYNLKTVTTRAWKRGYFDKN